MPQLINKSKRQLIKTMHTIETSSLKSSKSSSNITLGRKYHHKRCNFTQIPNDIIRSKTLSFAAKSIWGIIASLPDGFQISLERLADAFCKESYDTLKKTAIKLEENKLLFRRKHQNGRVDFILFDCPEDFIEFNNEYNQKLLTNDQIPNGGICPLGNPQRRDLPPLINTVIVKDYNKKKDIVLADVKTAHSSSSKKRNKYEYSDEFMKLWNHEITPKFARNGSMPTAFSRWNKITKNGKDKEKIEDINNGWMRHVLHREDMGINVKQLDTFLNPKEEWWKKDWDIEDKQKTKQEPKTQLEEPIPEPYSQKWKDELLRAAKLNLNGVSMDEVGKNWHDLTHITQKFISGRMDKRSNTTQRISDVV